MVSDYYYTFEHYPEAQFHFCHFRDCVRDAIKRENINMDEVLTPQTLKYKLFPDKPIHF